MVTQRQWRITGAVCIVSALIMVGYGPALVRPGTGVGILAAYWSIFVLLLFAAIYIAFMDMRYTHLHYKAGDRDLFKEMFLDAEFRDTLEEALKKHARSTGKDDEEPSG